MKKISLLFLCLSLVVLLQAQVYQSVNNTAGGLSAALTADGNLTTVTNLTVTGTIDARDFVTMCDSMTMLAVLDLSGVTIAAYTGTLTIPSSVTSIGVFAFYGCTGLNSINQKVKQVL
jgi:hypothetical protein